ncbi:hypothetical protein K7W42_07690 [Deinococcus sp. HMF7604]|uniref:hypothetical protein n=1 Tax=Deinococcus betulae TaxID=2873312 RepID=UPI001CCB16E7|nr:hypothetical protein [Deinococcus betulae]MBZ9750741.1 hypothetical protein [Deinococcus betulae]
MTQAVKPTLEDLLRDLHPLAHSREAVEKLQAFASAHRKTASVQEVMIAEGALIKPPIMHDHCCATGVCKLEEPFVVLQGDIVHTEAAYFMGVRFDGSGALYAVGTSTCDLVPGRREYAVIYPITPVRKPTTEEERKQISHMLNSVLKFTSSMYMFLPRFDDQDPALVLGNLVDLTRPHQIESNALLLAHRRYSLTEVGWRIFSTLVRHITSREAEDEVSIRNLPEAEPAAEESAV